MRYTSTFSGTRSGFSGSILRRSGKSLGNEVNSFRKWATILKNNVSLYTGCAFFSRFFWTSYDARCLFNGALGLRGGKSQTLLGVSNTPLSAIMNMPSGFYGFLFHFQRRVNNDLDCNHDHDRLSLWSTILHWTRRYRNYNAAGRGMWVRCGVMEWFFAAYTFCIRSLNSPLLLNLGLFAD